MVLTLYNYVQVREDGAADEELLQEKLDAIGQLQFIYDDFLACYIQPNGRMDPRSSNYFDLKKQVEATLLMPDTPTRVLLLLGTSGSGKTSFMLYLAALLSR